MLGVSSGGEISTEPHGDGAGGNLGQSGEQNEVRRPYGTGQAGRQREGNRQAIRESDDDVAHRVRRLKMLLMVLGMVRRRVQMHVGHRQSVRHYGERASVERFCDGRARLPCHFTVLIRSDATRNEGPADETAEESGQQSHWRCCYRWVP